MSVADRDGWICQLCHEPIDPKLRKPHPRALHVDHVRPRSDRGSDDPTNLRATHAMCNLERPRR